MPAGPLAPPPPGELAWARESDLLLREFSHRTGEEIAAVAAALQLAKMATTRVAAGRLIEEAIARLNCFADLHVLLSSPVRGDVEVHVELDAICRAIGNARPAAADSSMTLDLPSTRLDARVARRLSLAAAELVGDGVRNALEGRRGRLDVRLRRSGRTVSVRVSDDRPAGRRDVFADERRDIARELVALTGGSLSARSGPKGRVVSVAFPIRSDPVGPLDVPF